MADSNISATNYIRCFVINEAAGRSYGKNRYEVLDPKNVKILSQVIGHMGIDTTKYSVFKDFNLKRELSDRQAKTKNKQTYIIVRKPLLDLIPLHIVERWVTAKVLFDHY